MFKLATQTWFSRVQTAVRLTCRKIKPDLPEGKDIHWLALSLSLVC